MSISRNAIQDALLERLKEKMGGSIKAFTTENITVDQLNAQPGIILIPDTQVPSGDSSMPPEWNVRFTLGLAVKESVSAKAGGRELQDLLDRLEKSLERDKAERPIDASRFFTTLGGRVQWVRITAIDITQGGAGEQSLAEVSIEALAVA
jgi:hypothetical protein